MHWRIIEDPPKFNYRKALRRLTNLALSVGVATAACYAGDSPMFLPYSGPLANAATSILLRQAREIRDDATENLSPKAEMATDIVYGAMLIALSMGLCKTQMKSARMLPVAEGVAYATTGKTISEVGFDIADAPNKVWGIALNTFLKTWDRIQFPQTGLSRTATEPRSVEEATLRRSRSMEADRISMAPIPKNFDFPTLVQSQKEQQRVMRELIDLNHEQEAKLNYQSKILETLGGLLETHLKNGTQSELQSAHETIAQLLGEKKTWEQEMGKLQRELSDLRKGFPQIPHDQRSTVSDQSSGPSGVVGPSSSKRVVEFQSFSPNAQITQGRGRLMDSQHPTSRPQSLSDSRQPEPPIARTRAVSFSQAPTSTTPSAGGSFTILSPLPQTPISSAVATPQPGTSEATTSASIQDQREVASETPRTPLAQRPSGVRSHSMSDPRQSNAAPPPARASSLDLRR